MCWILTCFPASTVFDPQTPCASFYSTHEAPQNSRHTALAHVRIILGILGPVHRTKMIIASLTQLLTECTFHKSCSAVIYDEGNVNFSEYNINNQDKPAPPLGHVCILRNTIVSIPYNELWFNLTMVLNPLSFAAFINYTSSIQLIVAFLYLDVSLPYFVIQFPLCLTFKDLVGTRDMSKGFLEIDILAPQLVHMRKEGNSAIEWVATMCAGRKNWQADNNNNKKAAHRELEQHPQVVRKTHSKTLEGINGHKYHSNEAWQ